MAALSKTNQRRCGWLDLVQRSKTHPWDCTMITIPQCRFAVVRNPCPAFRSTRSLHSEFHLPRGIVLQGQFWNFGTHTVDPIHLARFLCPCGCCFEPGAENLEVIAIGSIGNYYADLHGDAYPTSVCTRRYCKSSPRGGGPRPSSHAVVRVMRV